MSRIKRDMSIMNCIMAVAEGNPGAMSAMLEIGEAFKRDDPQNPLNPVMAPSIFDSFEIYGTDAYVLWNDICDRDADKAMKVLMETKMGNFPLDFLKDACSRQDYSGKSIVPVQKLVEAYDEEKERMD